MHPSSPRFAIIGAGPSGLVINLFLKHPADILESTDHVGGHAASFFACGFTFDYGPHILFSRDQEILNFIVASLDDNVSRCRRNNKISFKDRLIKYPFENDLKSLPLEDNYACLHDFIFNPHKEKHLTPKNMKEWFLKTFGEGICSRYLFPYNEKVWNIPVEQLSMAMTDRIPTPPSEDILKSSLGYSTEGYLHQLYYFYPKIGGYQAISEAWGVAASITYQYTVDKIQFRKNKIFLISTQGQVREYDQVISTMPVHELINKLERDIPTEISIAVNKLIVNPMYIISFGIRGIDPNKYTAVYFPESEFLVNRISYPCTFSANNGPTEHWSIQAEITCARNSTTWQQSDTEMLTHVKQGLQKRRLLPSNDHIVFEKVHRQERSYVVYDIDYEQHANTVRKWFSSIGIHLLGRFSYFEYINVDMAVDRALKVAATLNGDKSDCPTTKSLYLKNALIQLNKMRPIPVL